MRAFLLFAITAVLAAQQPIGFHGSQCTACRQPAYVPQPPAPKQPTIEEMREQLRFCPPACPPKVEEFRKRLEQMRTEKAASKAT